MDSLAIRNVSSASKSISTPVDDDENDPDKPVKFSTSEASGWTMKKLRIEDLSINRLPWYKPVIFWSTFWVFIIYLIFRKRNETDDELDMPLGQRVLWIKEMQIMDEKGSRASQGLTTKSLDDELLEIERLRKKYNYK